MASSEKTTNLQLNKWTGSDRSQREDFNYDNKQIDGWAGQVNTQLNDMTQDIEGLKTVNTNVSYTLFNGWVLRDSDAKYAPKLIKSGKKVNLKTQVAVTEGTAAQNAIAIMGINEHKPNMSYEYTVSTLSGKHASVVFSPDGNITLYTAISGSSLSVSDILQLDLEYMEE